MSDLQQFRVTFERIGRNRGVPPLEVEARDGDALAHHIHVYAAKYLASRNYMVVVDGDRGSIDSGRFGTFTIAAAVRATPGDTT